MKRITPLTIILWSVLTLTGIACAVLAVLFHNLALLFWPLASVFWITLVIWIVITIIRSLSRGPQKSAVFANNQASMDRISRETNEAVARYLSTVTRKGFSKSAALHERPWFLMCGTPGSGKSSLLRGSGLDFPVQYPSDRDGALVEGGNQIQWYFGNEAVWIDTPGSCMADDGRDEWQALASSLRRVRPDCPVDGVALTVNISEVLAADDLQVKQLAQRLRGRIDDLIAGWGIEFPVYLLFNRADEIPGFAEFFSDRIAAGGNEVFGVTIPGRDDRSTSPRTVFNEEFNLLCKSLKDVRLDRLSAAPANAEKRMICRFVVHFQGIQQKLGVLAAELFKPSNYVGRPIFRGFYFTSCGERALEGAPRAAAGSPQISATIVNHPLNPNRGFAAMRSPGAPFAAAKRELRSLFVLPLFRGIMVRDKPLVKTTRGRSRQMAIRRWALLGSMGAAALLFMTFLITGYSRISGFYAEVGSSLSSLPPESAPLMEQYKALGIMQGIMGKLQKYEDRVPLSMGVGLYRGNALLSSFKNSYFYRLRRCMIAPAVKCLEYDIRETSGKFGELSGEDYDNLYRSLKGYLSIAESARSHPKDIDTAFLRTIMFDAIRRTILSGSGSERFPEKIETVLQENMGLLLTYLRRGEFPVIQENQRLVGDARSRLRRLPGATSLYEGLMSRLVEAAPRVTLDDLIGREGQGILSSSMVVSTLYSQQGWDQSVKPAIRDAAADPYRVDWVIGMKQQEVPDEKVDKEQLYDEMAAAFCDDFLKKWCGFLASIDMAPFIDLPQSSRMLQKLAAENSELETLLQAVGQITLMKDENAAAKAGGALMKAVAKVNPGVAKSTSSVKVPLTLTGNSPFHKMNASFDLLRSFSGSDAGALGGYAGYREKLLALADRLNAIEADGDNQVLSVFSGRDDDPLASAWKYTKNTLGVMPEDLALGLGPLLFRPLALTGTSASLALTRTLNARWQTEVLKPMTNRFSGRYPFSSQGEDASWNDVMDYFRPSTGTFWGFYDRVLSSYVVKTSSGWMVRNLGGISLTFNPELSAALSDAELLRTIFFQPDGTLRTLDMTITPQSSNKNAGTLEIDGQTVSLPQGGKGVRINWPLEGAQVRGAVLKLQTGKDFSQEIAFKGPWGLMKLLSAARVSKINGSAFTAKWQVNVQNMYMLNYEVRIQVASSDHPFTDPVFQRFNCPLELVAAGK